MEMVVFCNIRSKARPNAYISMAQSTWNVTKRGSLGQMCKPLRLELHETWQMLKEKGRMLYIFMKIVRIYDVKECLN